MSSRAHSDIARLRRLRRVAQRQNLTILVGTKTNSKQLSGLYMLSDDETRRPVFGNVPQPYSATMEQIEAFLGGGDDADAEE